MERIPQQDVSKQVYGQLLAIEGYIRTTGFDHKLLELMRFRVSLINNCAYCLDMHFKEAVHAGEDPKRLYSLSAWRETPYYTEEEQAILEFAEALTLVSNHGVSDAIFERMSQHFSTKQIADLTIAVIQINSWNRLTNVTRMEPGNYVVQG
ncbi:carboxymuconolactone decarboxylase family protein [soil metagenome]